MRSVKHLRNTLLGVEGAIEALLKLAESIERELELAETQPGGYQPVPIPPEAFGADARGARPCPCGRMTSDDCAGECDYKSWQH